jgi:hypothetical protein
MSIRAAGVLIALFAVGCGDDGPPLAPPDGSALDAFQPPWWTPHPGENTNWDIQRSMLDVTATRTMYDLDLWDVATATTIDYGDGAPVTVPAGPLAGKVAELHARTPRPIVVCHIDVGAIALDDPDASKFPGFEATPPDRPIAPKPGSVIGWSTIEPTKRFLDLREASQALWSATMAKRYDLAKQLGCDAVEGDYNDQVGQDTGFAITPPDVVAAYTSFAAEVHTRELSAGQKNGNLLTPGLVDLFDWMLIERCGEFDDCDTARPYIDQNKTVFALDYVRDADGGVDLTIACSRYPHALIREGLQKDVPLTSTVRMECP